MARFLTKDEISSELQRRKPSLNTLGTGVALGLRLAYEIRRKATSALPFKAGYKDPAPVNLKNAKSSKNNNKSRTWNIKNLTTGEIISGKYGEESYAETGTSAYAQYTALGREYPIQKFLHGELESFTFTGTIVAKHQGEYLKAKNDVLKLKQWSRLDQNLNRPVLVGFWTGDGSIVNYAEAILKATLKYKNMDINGVYTQFEVDIEVTRYEPFETQTRNFDTKYHYGVDGEYHELLAAKEYGNPLIGVALRALNEQSEIEDGVIVKLPAPGGSISKFKVKEYSAILSNLSDKKLSKSREILQEIIDNRYKQYNTMFTTAN